MVFCYVGAWHDGAFVTESESVRPPRDAHHPKWDFFSCSVSLSLGLPPSHSLSLSLFTSSFFPSRRIYTKVPSPGRVSPGKGKISQKASGGGGRRPTVTNGSKNEPIAPRKKKLLPMRDSNRHTSNVSKGQWNTKMRQRQRVYTLSGFKMNPTRV